MKAVSLGKQKKKSLPWRIVSGLANTALLIILALFVYLFWHFNADEESFYGTGSRRKSLLLLNKNTVSFCFTEAV